MTTEAAAPPSESTVITSSHNGVGRIELNKPKLINALSQEMVGDIDDALASWRDDDSIKAVLVTGRGERGLCAGGDIKAVYNDIVAGTDENARFWNREYKMNHAISEFPKPYVVIMNGITMGGGVGISGHGSHRIVTDSTKIGMPETGIGLFPDVGGTYLLARAPGELGTHLALTGQPVGAGAALAMGLADYYVPDAPVPGLIADLEAGGEIPAVIERYAADAPENELAEAAGWIDECYAGDRAEDIVAALAA
ncbi:MAG: 3-hydroxyisobutyryl-CoA hydrolase, partial [Brevibacterium sp.]|nr:3-hydroxyisobutyryl-CoA hydrolase [Brevibacterium sp.]